MSHDEGSTKARETGSVADTDDEAVALRDTAPGNLPAMELSRTLPTGAAFHATWRIPNLAAQHAHDAHAADDAHDAGQESGIHAVERSSAAAFESDGSATSTMPNPPNSRASDAASRATTPMKFSVPPVHHPSDAIEGDASSHLGATRREFTQPRLSPREKAKRNLLTHTLQMPLVVTPIPQPSAARTVDPAVRFTSTQRQGTLPMPMPLPRGWTSVQRVGSDAPSEASASRPPHARATEPMSFGGRESRPEPHGRPLREAVRAEPVRVHPALQDHSSFVRPQTVPSGSGEDSSRWTQLRTGDYERVTLPGDRIRIPDLSGREWMFIALLACASAATLYSLMVDDVTASIEEDSTSAATTVEHQHLVKPALPKPAALTPQTENAAVVASNTTEIVSEPSSAEIVVGGAVIGNTPAKVVRGTAEADYLLRKAGYEPQLVRVTPHSPKSITITLHPK